MTGSIHVLGPQGNDSNLTHAVNMFCPQGDIAVISAGWRYEECELQGLQRKLGRRLRHIPLYEWFDALGTIEPELSGLHRIRQRRILDYKSVPNQPRRRYEQLEINPQTFTEVTQPLTQRMSEKLAKMFQKCRSKLPQTSTTN